MNEEDSERGGGGGRCVQTKCSERRELRARTRYASVERGGETGGREEEEEEEVLLTAYNKGYVSVGVWGKWVTDSGTFFLF